MKPLLVSLLVVASLSAGQSTQTFTGVITDSECATGDHSRMRMGSNDAECTRACVSAHGASFVLYSSKEVYALTDQQTPDKFAGQKVRVTGTLDTKTKTIQVKTITAAQ
jgi:Protein of unknown function (DUF5818)